MKLFGTMKDNGDGGKWLVALIVPRAWRYIWNGQQKPFQLVQFDIYKQLFLFPFVIVWRVA